MNAVIVDIRGQYAAALDENGSVVKIPNAKYVIGQKIELHELHQVHKLSIKKMGTVAAAAALALCIGTGTVYALPYGTVSLESDSAIEYTINRFDRVLKVRALNEEGETVLSALDEQTLRYRPVEEAIAVTLEQQGADEEIQFPVQIKAETKNERHTERLQEQLSGRISTSSFLRPGEMQNAAGEGIPDNLPGISAPGQQVPSNLSPSGLNENPRPSQESAAGSSEEPPQIQGLPESMDGEPASESPSKTVFAFRENPPASLESMPPESTSSESTQFPGGRAEDTGTPPAHPAWPVSAEDTSGQPAPHNDRGTSGQGAFGGAGFGEPSPAR